jgi:phospholipase D1/2
VMAARRSVLIVGWDVDSRVRLVPEDEPADGHPPTLLAFLNAVLSRKPELRVHVLGWDFSMIYAFEREALPAYKFGWRGHRRLHFALDAVHPQLASHHQKLVVVDDQIAFCGGLDLTIRRWDTTEHRSDDARRTDPKGVIYAPTHDVQMAVDGEAAAALGALARERWSSATGETLPAVELPGDEHPWPRVLAADLGPTEVGLARTWPSLDGGADIQEILRLTLAGIAAARRTIFVENQYLTSAAAGEALAHRLAEAEGPEVVLVLPEVECGWLEQSSMGILRSRLLARLRQADSHGRLQVLSPVVPGLRSGCVNVHSKVLVFDDHLLKVGSANLSNRSMGLDTECDLAIEAAGSADDVRRVERGIARFRSRLLGEHLGVAPEVVEERTASTGSLARAIASLSGGPRTLRPLAEGTPPALNLAVLDGLMVDPERPIAAEQLIDEFVPDHVRTPAQRILHGSIAMLAALLVVALLWRFSPAVRWLGADELPAWGAWLRGDPLAPLVVLGVFACGALVLFPATLLVGATVLLCGWPLGALYAWAAAILVSALGYAAGRRSRRRVRRTWSPQTMWLRGQLRRRGWLALAVARLLPVSNFTVMNLVAGALRVPFRRFLLATTLGLLPGILGLALFAERVGAVVREPGAKNLFLLAALLVALGGGVGWLRRRLGRSATTGRPLVGLA